MAVHTLFANLAQVDLDRVKYVLACWMAERLAKIEAHPLHMRDKVEHFSDPEVEYLKEYGSFLHEHLHQTVLDHIPQAWQRLDEPNMIDQPDYNSYHFWLVNETIGVDEVEQRGGNDAGGEIHGHERLYAGQQGGAFAIIMIIEKHCDVDGSKLQLVEVCRTGRVFFLFQSRKRRDSRSKLSGTKTEKCA